MSVLLCPCGALQTEQWPTHMPHGPLLQDLAVASCDAFISPHPQGSGAAAAICRTQPCLAFFFQTPPMPFVDSLVTTPPGPLAPRPALRTWRRACRCTARTARRPLASRTSSARAAQSAHHQQHQQRQQQHHNSFKTIKYTSPSCQKPRLSTPGKDCLAGTHLEVP